MMSDVTLAIAAVLAVGLVVGFIVGRRLTSPTDAANERAEIRVDIPQGGAATLNYTLPAGTDLDLEMSCEGDVFYRKWTVMGREFEFGDQNYAKTPGGILRRSAAFDAELASIKADLETLRAQEWSAPENEGEERSE